MHIADVDVGMLGANGIVGAGPPLACGAGLASKLRKDGSVSVVFLVTVLQIREQTSSR